MHIAKCFLFVNLRCVDETETENLCKGIPFCQNMADLKFCKNAMSWNLPSAGWELYKGIRAGVRVSCNYLYYPNNQSRRGQLIEGVTNKDGKLYNCINRRDENPFKLYSGTEIQEDWLNLFNEGNDY